MNIEPESQPKGAARVGMEMRLVRERLGWRLADVAAELRIRLPYLEAIERGELSALPGAAYQTGFVRTYSQALGLDGDEILRRFRAEGTAFVPKAELAFLAPVPDRAVPTGALVLLGVVLVLVGYGVWYRYTEQQARLAAQIPNVPTELAPLAVPPKPPEPLKPTIVPTALPPTAPPTATGTAASVTPAPATAAPPTAPAAANPPPPAVQNQVIMATGDTWVGVWDSKGTVIFSRTLHGGDSWPVPDLPGLTMTAGNAGDTMISDNGKVGAPLGAPDTAIHRYALTAALPGAPTQSGITPGAPPTGTGAKPAASTPAAAKPTPVPVPATIPVPVPAPVPAPAHPAANSAVEGPAATN